MLTPLSESMRAMAAEAAYAAAEMSEDPSTAVGGCLVPRDSSGEHYCGHNTFVGPEDWDPRTGSREERYRNVVHAEELVLQAAGLRAVGATYYATHEPCGKCWRRLALAGISHVVFQKTTPDRRERWECEEGRRIAFEHGMTFREVSRL